MKSLILLVVLLVGCNATVSDVDIQRAIKDCQLNGGVQKIVSEPDVYRVQAYCKNSARFLYTSSGK